MVRVMVDAFEQAESVRPCLGEKLAVRHSGVGKR
jgi:hypothetical protein